MTCTVHVAGTCRIHDHDCAACPECGALPGMPCTPAIARYAPWCCPGCYHHHEGA